MKHFIWLNISMEKSSILEDLMDNSILKEIPYGSKYKTPDLEYNNIFIPYVAAEMKQDYLYFREYINSRIQISKSHFDENIIYSIYNMFALVLTKSKGIKFSINGVVSSNKFGISYTDGSFSNKVGSAGYACCKLTDIANNGLYDSFSGDRFLHESFSGKIDDGTNNIGELTAIKVAIENFNEKDFQIIISDSIYGIKSYREYIHVWKNNGYLAYNNKPIKNKELIINTFDKIKEQQKSNKIIVFCWTKGHANNQFNEQCDILAKGEIGI